MEFFKNIKKNIDLIANKINEIKQKIDDFKQMAKDSIFTKTAYWFFMICIWWPVKYSFLFLYYVGIWPFLKIMSFDTGSSNNYTGSSDDYDSSSNNLSESSKPRSSDRRTWKIQFYNGSTWNDCLVGDSTSHNYISQQLQIKKQQNNGKKVRAIYADTNTVIDIL